MNMRTLLMIAVLLSGPALAQSVAHFKPQAFLAGNCWKGTFPDGKQIDEHCFEWVYGGQFLRDRHTVTGGKAPYAGETIYFWDATTKSVNYLYINVLGGNSRGTLQVADGVLVFPEDKYNDGKQEQTFRSSWRRDGDDAYFVITEAKAPDGWKEAWRVRMLRQK
jgi:hypothetical protein